MTTTLYRAASDTYTGYGSCYAADRAAAQTYHSNPGMGGMTLISVELSDSASICHIDWQTLGELDAAIGVETDHDWDYVYEAGEDTRWAGPRAAGYDWVMYDEAQIGDASGVVTTYQYIGDADAGAATVIYTLDADAIVELSAVEHVIDMLDIETIEDIEDGETVVWRLLDEQLSELILEDFGALCDHIGGIAA